MIFVRKDLTATSTIDLTADEDVSQDLNKRGSIDSHESTDKGMNNTNVPPIGQGGPTF